MGSLLVVGNIERIDIFAGSTSEDRDSSDESESYILGNGTQRIPSEGITPEPSRECRCIWKVFDSREREPSGGITPDVS